MGKRKKEQEHGVVETEVSAAPDLSEEANNHDPSPAPEPETLRIRFIRNSVYMGKVVVAGTVRELPAVSAQRRIADGEAEKV